MKKYTKIFFALLPIFLLILLLICSKQAGEGVRQGLTLSFRAVLPALFPAMVLSGMVGELAESLPFPPALTVWITSHLCGFPLGVRTMTMSYRRGLLTQKQAVKLSACCANASPAFLITFTGELVLGSAKKGVLLFLGQVLISGFLFLICGALKDPIQREPEERPLLPVLTKSISAAAAGGLTLTAYITVFSVIAALLNELPGFRYFYGFLELSGGLAALPQNALQFFLAAAMVGFSGFSIFFQNASYLLEEQLPIWPLLAGKVFYGLCLPAIMSIFCFL
ncbi:MAG: hypothetical protein IJ333_03250 [Clostridia bacterium]|nr:hypothetical protein [Clostridia bacterium]